METCETRRLAIATSPTLLCTLDKGVPKSRGSSLWFLGSLYMVWKGGEGALATKITKGKWEVQELGMMDERDLVSCSLGYGSHRCNLRGCSTKDG
jgi:hypothetical protein